MNFFQPVAKLIGRQRVGARTLKCYDQLRTPYQRVLAAGVLSEAQRLDLARLYLSLNPVQLQAQNHHCPGEVLAPDRSVLLKGLHGKMFGNPNFEATTSR